MSRRRYVDSHEEFHERYVATVPQQGCVSLDSSS